ncbi:MAG: bifunctional transaldolase/phosoglucose isomerase [Legionellales bacterium]|jgi:glucose-6-phosphate isomerase
MKSNPKNTIQRLWQGDPSLWTNSDESTWLGWLTIAQSELSEAERIENLAQAIKLVGFTDIVLLGMGGSSLCPAMLAKTFGKIDDYPKLHILDSTDPMQILHLEQRIDLQHTFFIVSSKSGTTLEPNIFKQYFYQRLQALLNKTDVGDRFLAITDPGTALDILAKKENFKTVFYGKPSIGGRYSALSNFGMAPFGLMGGDVKNFISYASIMAHACSTDNDNPGLILGLTLGLCAQQGKNKITLIVSPGIQSLGGWLEQLLAESTGKHGKGLIPVDQEPVGAPNVYGNDRLFIYIRLESASDLEQDNAIIALEKAGQSVVRSHVLEKNQLGAELFKWEIATAIAGSILDINPFNQPDVEASKIRARQLITEYEQTGKVSSPQPFFEENGIALFTDVNNEKVLSLSLKGKGTIENYLRAHFNRIQEGDYVDLSAFIEMSDAHITLLQQSRVAIRDTKKVATCLGFGPRFLHSTGQVYKGGPNTGVFLQITADHLQDIKIPGKNYTFGIVNNVQAQGDFEVLTQLSRRALRIHLKKDVYAGLQQLHDYIKKAFL